MTLPFLSIIALILSLPVGMVKGQGYCQCGPALFRNDPLQLCMTSSQYGVQNSCFTCPVVNTSGSFFLCFPMYQLGYGSCAAGYQASVVACQAVGGDTQSSGFFCVDSVGPNQSQVQACPAFTVPPSAPTAPTSDGYAMTPYDSLTLIGVLLFCYVTM